MARGEDKKLGFAQALQQIEGGKIERAYLLLGEDYYQKFLITEKITSARLSPADRKLNRHSLAGRKLAAETLEQALAGVPLFGGNTVVIISDIEKVTEKIQPLLARLVSEMSSGVTLVAQGVKLDGRKAFAKALAAHCTVVETKPIYDSQVTTYVQSRFAARGITVDTTAANEFSRIVGNSCGEIENEIEKLSIVHAGKKKLVLTEIQSYLSASNYFSQFEVAEAVANRKLRATLTATRNFLQSAGSGAGGQLFWALYTQFERMMLVQEHSGRMADADLAGRLRMHPFLLKQLQAKAALFQPAELAVALHETYRAEVDDRFNSHEVKQQIFERLILRIAFSGRE